MTAQRQIVTGLIGVVGGLLAVGLVSHTPLRHVVQVIPALLTLYLLKRQVTWARFAAIPILLFWFLIMLGIWLFLLGVARVITGTYSPLEIILTVLIGLSSCLGLVGSAKSAPNGPRWNAAVAFLGFVVLQIGALWLSLQPAFERS